METVEKQMKNTFDKVVKRVNDRIGALVDEADAYSLKMNEDYEYFFRWEAESMYKVQITLQAYRRLKHVVDNGILSDVKDHLKRKIEWISNNLINGSLRLSSSSATTSIAHILRLEVEQKIRTEFIMLLDLIQEQA